MQHMSFLTEEQLLRLYLRHAPQVAPHIGFRSAPTLLHHNSSATQQDTPETDPQRTLCFLGVGCSYLGLRGQLRGADDRSESSGHFFDGLRWQSVLRSRDTLSSERQRSKRTGA